jgi:hypothetical protein
MKEDEKELIALEAFIASSAKIKNGMPVLALKKVAELYQTDEEDFIKRLRKNLNRFPEDFMMLENNKIEEAFFTEAGILMAGGMLGSKKAARIQVLVITRFTTIFHQVKNNKDDTVFDSLFGQKEK